MKTMIAVKLAVLGLLIVLAGYWLKGHDRLTEIVLVALVLLISLKLIFYLRGRSGGPGPKGGGGSDLSGSPVPTPPARPTPRELSAVPH
jgi:hypothetical protein